MRSAESRFWEKVDASGDCWLWTAGQNGIGYGLFYVPSPTGPKNIAAHRFAYQTLVGPLPRSTVLDHLCRNSLCVNPDHMQPTTQKQNILRGYSPFAASARKTTCKNGHPFNEIIRGGARSCRECRLADHRAYMAVYRLTHPKRKK